MERLIKSREMSLKRMQDALACAKNCLENPSFIPRLRTWVQRSISFIETFETVHIAILSNTTSDEDLQKEYLIQNTFDDIHGQFLEIQSIVLPKIESIVSPKATTSSENKSHIKLPKINLIKFDGTNHKEWSSFINMFDTLVHNNASLSNVEKFQYLISVLSREPASLLKAFTISDANYISAYDSLVSRYHNKRQLAFISWEEIVNVKLVPNSANDLRHLMDALSENLAILKNLGLPVDNWDFVLVNLVLKKLDLHTRQQFELTQSKQDIPTFTSLQTFLNDYCLAMERAKFKPTPTYETNLLQATKNIPSPTYNRTNKKSTTLVSNETLKPCILCKALHTLILCPDFKNKTPQERFNFIKSKQLCLNCLRDKHLLSRCTSRFNCRTCGSRHHTLLHFDKSPIHSSQSSGSQSVTRADLVSPVNTNSACMYTTSNTSTVLLSTAKVSILDSCGNFQTIRVLLDCASQSNIITSACVERLGLTPDPLIRNISGLASKKTRCSGEVQCFLRSLKDLNCSFTVNATVMDSICGNMPTVNVPNNTFMSNVFHADDTYNISSPIDMLLGAEVYPLILEEGRFTGDGVIPSAQNTVFGWVFMGKTALINHIPTDLTSNSLCAECPISETLDHQLQKLWQIEDIPFNNSVSQDDDFCETNFVETYSRDNNGRFIVSLPFRDLEPKFNGSRLIALRRFYSLEKRLSSDAKLHKQYVDFMRDYLDSNHMELISPIQQNSADAYFIPHHCVVKADITKLRVVFDASCKDSNGVSLNSALLSGPKLQIDLCTILLRFRIHSIVFTSDIRQMYRQILIKNQQADTYQRILWRFSPNEPIQEYRLKTVTYGVNSSPFLAIRTLRELATEEHDKFPLASQVLTRDTYVDDIVTGASNIADAILLQKQLIGLLEKGRFELRKWASNSESVLEHIDADFCINKSFTFESDQLNCIKILGMRWYSTDDDFAYHLEQNLDKPCTKRNVLSTLAQIYDPLGFLGPLTFLAKCLIQKLWLLGLTWDDTPPVDIQNKWNSFIREFPILASLRIPRRVSVDQVLSYQIHGFCDASEAGYAAVVYLRAVHMNKSIHLSLLCAKSRVAPLKRITLPRLELCAATLLADLLEYVLRVITPLLSIEHVYAWSDSTITLSWIRSQSSRWKTFVGNRVSRIQRKVPSATWQHVASKDNPADCASRGLQPSELISHNLWWQGPDWLSSDNADWPTEDESDAHEIVSPDIISEERISAMPTSLEINSVDNLLSRFSSLPKILRVLSYCKRFICIARKTNNASYYNKPFTKKELHASLLTLVKYVQSQCFADDIIKLQNKKLLSKPLRKLRPFLDDDGLLLVGGRISNSELLFQTKHPALLPRDHILTKLIIEDVHRTHLHPGLESMRFLISQNFWILSARRVIRHTLSKCYKCFRAKPVSLQPLMGDLPKLRVTQLKPFQVVGIDYAGPLRISMQRRRGSLTLKAYICVFVCFSTKALHLELVSDMTSEAFLACLRRFISRRGRCAIINSDCGSNFQAAQRHLSKLMKDAAEQEQIEFRFIPPGSPHFGGLWEASVKSVKTHLTRVIGQQILSYEELYTVLTQIEAVLNSRPLCPLSSDPNDMSVLTPGHFLTLAPLTTVPSVDYSGVKINRLTRWQLLQRFHQDFWKRWHKEYLNTLMQRSKWDKDGRSAKVGDIVVIKDENSPPLQWRLGRITTLHPGRDGICRVASLRTANGDIKRPFVKLCPLPYEEDNSNV